MAAASPATEKLNEASLAINSALGMNQLLRLVVERGVEIFGARGVALVATFGLGARRRLKIIAPVAAGQDDEEADATRWNCNGSLRRARPRHLPGRRQRTTIVICNWKDIARRIDGRFARPRSWSLRWWDATAAISA